MPAAEPLFPDLRLPTIAGALREARPLWEALGVAQVRVFGSVARGEAGPNSDIDVLIEFQPGPARGLLDLMRVRQQLLCIPSRRLLLMKLLQMQLLNPFAQ
mgnify:CR=1 FL=1